MKTFLQNVKTIVIKSDSEIITDKIGPILSLNQVKTKEGEEAIGPERTIFNNLRITKPKLLKTFNGILHLDRCFNSKQLLNKALHYILDKDSTVKELTIIDDNWDEKILEEINELNSFPQFEAISFGIPKDIISEHEDIIEKLVAHKLKNNKKIIITKI